MEGKSVRELVTAIKNKEISPVEVASYYMEQTEKLNGDINAFVTMNDNLLADAKEAEAAVMRGDRTGLLHGIPVGIKDLTPVKGMRTTFGSPAAKDFIADRDATIVKRLRQAGALIMGKTNTPEFGHKGTTDNLVFGATVNPWDYTKTAGGSSGGSAAAVAAGMVPLAEGSDGGGSIRIPASLCGIFGFKPTYGRIPMDNNLNNVFGSSAPFVNHGPLSKKPDDSAMFLEAVQGPSATDPFSLPLLDKHIGSSYLEEQAEGLRIAYTPDFGMYAVDPEVQKAVEATFDHWRTLGMSVEVVDLNFDMDRHQFNGFFTSMWYAASAAGSAKLLEEHPEWVSDSYREMIEKGKPLMASEYRAYERNRTTVWNRLQTVLQDYDLVLSPTLAVPAFDYHLLGPSVIDGQVVKEDADWMMTHAYNVTGLPSASLPAGLSQNGLPIGMQIAANRFEDARVLRAAQAYMDAYPLT
ncbi:amidase/aspartyl-tRNA(Asn)/glutamyl-tRNA(Gln) amidotransferase subunit A [Terribacillus aidingensis]|uniref:Amidase/aspartyl-tRNA(Asn)/glutamyl-tRNA(Gln) amidotransferase subunit A n=1 Tax=Terribacillus aidingensis TaxID=586416 RepID=A0A285N3V0_9BACI|nr:amidase family protein [Terribacillus aidingensis]SNZ04154.1 amidase/aspartyl-tRNA(Asn)/glutamyl-tRNA(Gln) amidotransferase subunit A [Terribacillus aidingensis]